MDIVCTYWREKETTVELKSGNRVIFLLCFVGQLTVVQLLLHGQWLCLNGRGDQVDCWMDCVGRSIHHMTCYRGQLIAYSRSASVVEGALVGTCGKSRHILKAKVLRPVPDSRRTFCSEIGLIVDGQATHITLTVL